MERQGGMERLLKAARASGSLNISNRGLTYGCTIGSLDLIAAVFGLLLIWLFWGRVGLVFLEHVVSGKNLGWVCLIISKNGHCGFGGHLSAGGSYTCLFLSILFGCTWCHYLNSSAKIDNSMGNLNLFQSLLPDPPASLQVFGKALSLGG